MSFAPPWGAIYLLWSTFWLFCFKEQGLGARNPFSYQGQIQLFPSSRVTASPQHDEWFRSTALRFLALLPIHLENIFSHSIAHCMHPKTQWKLFYWQDASEMSWKESLLKKQGGTGKCCNLFRLLLLHFVQKWLVCVQSFVSVPCSLPNPSLSSFCPFPFYWCIDVSIG